MGFLRRLLYGSAATQDDQVDAWLLNPKRPDALLNVVGEHAYQDALAIVSGGKTPDGPRIRDHVAALVPEPENRYDRNAIRVQIDRNRIGYLSREDAVAYGPVLAWALSNRHYVAANAAITGGWDRGRDDTGYFGVVLRMGTPAETLAELFLDQDPMPLPAGHQWTGQVVVFTGQSSCALGGVVLDRHASELLAAWAGLTPHPRITRKSQLLVICEPGLQTAKVSLAAEHAVPTVLEADFWRQVGLPVTSFGQRLILTAPGRQ